MEDASRYHDIIDLPHHVSARRPHMSMLNRAAQFSPFAALTGYEASIREAARLTDARVELDECEKAALDAKLHIIQSDPQMPVSVTYFVPDARKAGGAYVTAEGPVRKVDDVRHIVQMADRTEIPIEDIIGIDGDFPLADRAMDNGTDDHFA